MTWLQPLRHQIKSSSSLGKSRPATKLPSRHGLIVANVDLSLEFHTALFEDNRGKD